MSAPQTVHLLCSVGAAERLEEATYKLDGERYTTRFAPVALARLRGLRGRASVLVTRRAFEIWYGALATELSDSGLDPQPVRVPDGRTEEEIGAVLTAIMDVVQPSERVVLDVTFALRHLPFVYLAALTYLTAHRGVTIDGIYYGAYELRDTATNEAPILDLSELFRLTQWYQVLRTATDSGDLRGMADLLTSDVSLSYQRGQADAMLSRVKDRLRTLSQALAAGLPLESGLEAARACEALAQASTTASPYQHLALERLREWMSPLAADSQVPRKEKLVLTEAELERQLRLAEWYVTRGDLPKALMLLREWLVSFVLLRTGQADGWLNLSRREAAAQRLNAMARRAQEKYASPAEEHLAAVWQPIADRRNPFAHAGMRARPVSVSTGDVEASLDACRTLLKNEQLGIPPSPTGPRVLISPLGKAPGVIYCGVRKTQPEHLVVITSAEARTRLAEALAAADAADLPCTVKEPADPYGGYGEATALLDSDLKRLLVGAAEVVVNITGGTTAIQLVVERLASEAQRLGVPTRRVMLIDKRSSEEQRAEPYVLGELVEIERLVKDEESGHA